MSNSGVETFRCPFNFGNENSAQTKESDLEPSYIIPPPWLTRPPQTRYPDSLFYPPLTTTTILYGCYFQTSTTSGIKLCLSEEWMDTIVVPLVTHLRAGAYTCAAGGTILLYDILLTTKDEMRLIWPSRWSLVKCLYLVVRRRSPSGLTRSLFARIVIYRFLVWFWECTVCRHGSLSNRS